MAAGGRRPAICLATCMCVLACSGGALAFDEYSLDFQPLTAEIKRDAAARFYRQAMARWPTAMHQTRIGFRVCIGGLTITMLDQKEPDTAQWVVLVLDCSVQSSSAANTLTFVATRDVWKSCCTGIENDPERDYVALHFRVKGATW